MGNRIISAVTLLVASLTSLSSAPARAQDSTTHFQIGIVYYQDGHDYKPLAKETSRESGRSNYTAKLRGAHAIFRLRSDQPQVFRVCGVDPSRFKLYRFRSERNARTLTIAKNNIWIGGSKMVISESEIPVAIKAVEGDCFALTPQKTLANGEFGFSPEGSLDAFMFGVGDVEQVK